MATAKLYGNTRTLTYGVPADLLDALGAALQGHRTATPPQADEFDDLTATIARTSRLIQHLEAFRELAIVAADDTSPSADRKAIAFAAGIPPSRLYRILDRHGRPTVRSSRPLIQGMQRVTDAANEVAKQMAVITALTKDLPDAE